MEKRTDDDGAASGGVSPRMLEPARPGAVDSLSEMGMSMGREAGSELSIRCRQPNNGMDGEEQSRTQVPDAGVRGRRRCSPSGR